MLSGGFFNLQEISISEDIKKNMFSEHMLDKRMFGDLVNPDKLILQGTENLNFTEWTEMNLKLNIMSENDIAEFKKNVHCAFQKN